MYVFLFFFSSRRRHTRSLCDWSSDVCSSDLVSVGGVLGHELSAAGLSDLFHISRMGPNPFHLAGQVLGITRGKVYPGALRCYPFSDASQAAEVGSPACLRGVPDACAGLRQVAKSRDRQ